MFLDQHLSMRLVPLKLKAAAQQIQVEDSTNTITAVTSCRSSRCSMVYYWFHAPKVSFASHQDLLHLAIMPTFATCSHMVEVTRLGRQVPLRLGVRERLSISGHTTEKGYWMRWWLWVAQSVGTSIATTDMATADMAIGTDVESSCYPSWDSPWLGYLPGYH